MSWASTVNNALKTAKPNPNPTNNFRNSTSDSNALKCCRIVDVADMRNDGGDNSYRSLSNPRNSADREGGVGGSARNHPMAHTAEAVASVACTNSKVFMPSTSCGVGHTCPVVLVWLASCMEEDGDTEDDEDDDREEATTQLTNKVGMTWPPALPKGLNNAATTVATSRSELGNQSPANLAGTLVNKGCANAGNAWPTNNIP